MEELFQVLIAIIILGGPVIAQLVSRKKKGQAGRPATPRTQPAQRRASEDIAERVKRMLAEAAGEERKPPPPPRPEPVLPEPVEERKPMAKPGMHTLLEHDQTGKSIMDGDWSPERSGSVFTGLNQRKKRRRRSALGTGRLSLTPARIRSLFRQTPELAVIGLEIMGPPRALQDRK